MVELHIFTFLCLQMHHTNKWEKGQIKGKCQNQNQVAYTLFQSRPTGYQLHYRPYSYMSFAVLKNNAPIYNSASLIYIAIVRYQRIMVAKRALQLIPIPSSARFCSEAACLLPQNCPANSTKHCFWLPYCYWWKVFGQTLSVWRCSYVAKFFFLVDTCMYI